MSRDPLVIFTDGACSGNPGPGGWAVVMVVDDEVVELAGGLDHTTNNIMELTGALRALQAAADWSGPVEIRTDSTYVLKGITEWVKGWMARGWTTKEGKPVANQPLWKALEEEARKFKGRLIWTHVKAHSGIAGNERADELAVDVSQGREPQLYRGPLAKYPWLEKPGDASRDHRPAGPYYVSVVQGRVARHQTWPECQARVNGVSGARFKKVKSASEEARVLREWGVQSEG